MFWVVQHNIFKEQKDSVLIRTLEERNIPYIEVKVVPFYDKLLASDFDSNSYYQSIEQVPEVDIPNDLPIMVLGSTSLMRIAKEREWQPGSFLNENFHYDKWKEAYGNELLNAESVMDTFRNITVSWDTFFIRPCEDTKDFSGTVYTKEEFEAWREEILRVEDTCPFADKDVVASPLQHILAEYRFFVVNGKIVTYSQYKKGDAVISSPIVDEHVISYAQSMVDKWQPAKAFVIDVADTANGYKVIEINNFNSAGFYASDVAKLIEAIEQMDISI